MKNTLQFSRASVPLHVDRDFLAREQMGAIWEVIPNIGGRPFILQAFGDKALDIHANGSAVLIIELRDLGDARMMTSRIHDTRIISIDPPYFDHASDDELAALHAGSLPRRGIASPSFDAAPAVTDYRAAAAVSGRSVP